METQRQKKVARLLQKELSMVFQREVRPPSGVLLTINVIRVTSDLSQAKIYVSVLPRERRKRVTAFLNENVREIRMKLAAQIRHSLRVTPELLFYEDDTLDYVEKMDEIFDQIKTHPAPDDSEE